MAQAPHNGLLAPGVRQPLSPASTAQLNHSAYTNFGVAQSSSGEVNLKKAKKSAAPPSLTAAFQPDTSLLRLSLYGPVEFLTPLPSLCGSPTSHCFPTRTQRDTFSPSLSLTLSFFRSFIFIICVFFSPPLLPRPLLSLHLFSPIVRLHILRCSYFVIPFPWLLLPLPLHPPFFHFRFCTYMSGWNVRPQTSYPSLPS
jgi:hypothetical protein